MDPLTYSGGAVVAMKGKKCVAIATDKRLGVGNQLITSNFSKVFEMGPHLYIGLPGLATDTITVRDKLKFRLNLFELKENRTIPQKAFRNILSNLLYENRFGPYLVEPVIARLIPGTYEPYVCNMDLIGCPNEPDGFVVAGTCSKHLYGMCEALWEPDLRPAQLFESVSQALMNAFDRDALSGMGADVYIIEKHKVTIRTLKSRMD